MTRVQIESSTCPSRCMLDLYFRCQQPFQKHLTKKYLSGRFRESQVPWGLPFWKGGQNIKNNIQTFVYSFERKINPPIPSFEPISLPESDQACAVVANRPKEIAHLIHLPSFYTSPQKLFLTSPHEKTYGSFPEGLCRPTMRQDRIMEHI